MRLVAATSAKAKTCMAFDEFARECASEHGWDCVLLELYEVAGLTRKPKGPEGAIWSLGNSDGWPSVLRRLADLMDEAGIRCDVFAGTSLESPEATDAVDPSAADTGKPPTRANSSSSASSIGRIAAAGEKA